MHNGALAFKLDVEQICDQLTNLKYVEDENGLPNLSGFLILNDTIGQEVDTYHIKIIPTTKYPFEFPYVFETGGRIPINIEWHVFTDGHCCLKSQPEEMLLCKKAINLPWFIEEQIKPYFFNQKFRELNGYFLQEHSHGPKGNIEFFEDVFKTKDIKLIARGLLYIKRRMEPNRTNDCFCGSGLKYRKCHKEAYRKLSPFTDEELSMFAKFLFEQNNFF